MKKLRVESHNVEYKHYLVLKFLSPTLHLREITLKCLDIKNTPKYKEMSIYFWQSVANDSTWLFRSYLSFSVNYSLNE